MSDRRLLVSDADIDIARLLVKLDRLDGRVSDPATLRIANAAAFDDADDDAEYDVADDVATESSYDTAEGDRGRAGCGKGVGSPLRAASPPMGEGPPQPGCPRHPRVLNRLADRCDGGARPRLNRGDDHPALPVGGPSYAGRHG